jgi:glutaminase
VAAVSEDHLVSTGQLPEIADVQRLLSASYEAVRPVDEGDVASYIGALASTPPDLFGAAITGVGGGVAEVGDSDHEFSIQSVSKPFTFALVVESIGADAARSRVGVNSTGQRFDSVMAVELNEERTMNAMVNAGAIATASLLPGATAADKWALAREGLDRFAGKNLVFDDDVYASESETNLRNQGIAHLLAGYGRLGFDPDEATDIYTRLCSLRVTARDLSVMGATLADGGVNPVTGERVVSADTCRRVLAVLATAGLYERSGEWLYEIGLPGKSGVSGGIVTIAPGKGGLGTFSPRLDHAGNSVRGTKLTALLSHQLGLDIFASQPAR